jgi:hypothetical protein
VVDCVALGAEGGGARVGWEERDVDDVADGGGTRGGGGGRGWWRWVGVHTISNLLPLNPSPLPGRLGRATGHPFLAWSLDLLASTSSGYIPSRRRLGTVQAFAGLLFPCSDRFR